RSPPPPRLVKAGYKEVILTGIHLGSYGRDLDDADGIDLAGITRMVAAVDGLARVRLSSVEPTDVTVELIRLVAENPRVCRHLHIPLQSGNDATLKRMNRKYSTAEFAGAVQRVRREAPGVAISTDVIVGFPGETDADFASSLDFVREMAFSRLHVFKYSPRKGTAAARFPGQAPGRVKEERSQAMIHLGEELSLDFHRKFVGEVLEVLFEQSEEPGYLSGLTDNYIKVEAPVVGAETLTGEGVEALTGEIRPVRLMKAYADRMRGVIESRPG
ncbi:MAG: MiaB/RimO family radical SAM methylthiotransferase, partial [Firmicutes bacterium]|nr:MiaB/RimO family radical SAM methylthiotransferase [Bacillota bacterium]